MITIRSAENLTKPTLIGVEATLTTESAVYTLSSNGPLLERSSTLAGGLFGSIAWPRTRFRVGLGVVLEQLLLLPHDGSAAAFSWELSDNPAASVHLQIRPVFAGCSKRSYRDVGFRFQSAQEGGRLTWLPSALGPTIIADTNGTYRDDCSFGRDSSTLEDHVTPGIFEFELSNRPSVLIFTNDQIGSMPNRDLIGTFLAGLLPANHRTCGHSTNTLAIESSLLAA